MTVLGDHPGIGYLSVGDDVLHHSAAQTADAGGDLLRVLLEGGIVDRAPLGAEDDELGHAGRSAELLLQESLRLQRFGLVGGGTRGGEGASQERGDEDHGRQYGHDPDADRAPRMAGAPPAEYGEL